MKSEALPPIGHVLGADIWAYPDEAWEAPNYLISVDPGQGKVSESTAIVWRVNPYESEDRRLVQHVATLKGLYDPQTFAPMVMELGYYYRTAKIAPERNGHGMAFTAAITDYPNLYYQTDVVNGISTKVIGWATTGAARVGSRGTKTYMMDELKHLLSDMELRDSSVISQIMQVRRGDGGKLVFLGPDDLHDAAAIMAATRPSAMYSGKKGFVGTKGWRN